MHVLTGGKKKFFFRKMKRNEIWIEKFHLITLLAHDVMCMYSNSLLLRLINYLLHFFLLFHGTWYLLLFLFRVNFLKQSKEIFSTLLWKECSYAMTLTYLSDYQTYTNSRTYIDLISWMPFPLQVFVSSSL